MDGVKVKRKRTTCSFCVRSLLVPQDDPHDQVQRRKLIKTCSDYRSFELTIPMNCSFEKVPFCNGCKNLLRRLSKALLMKDEAGGEASTAEDIYKEIELKVASGQFAYLQLNGTPHLIDELESQKWTGLKDKILQAYMRKPNDTVSEAEAQEKRGDSTCQSTVSAKASSQNVPIRVEEVGASSPRLNTSPNPSEVPITGKKRKVAAVAVYRDGVQIWICPVCKQEEDENTKAFVISCDGCEDWFHCSCVNVNHDDPEISWFCKPCTITSDSGKEKVEHEFDNSLSIPSCPKI